MPNERMRGWRSFGTLDEGAIAVPVMHDRL